MKKQTGYEKQKLVYIKRINFFKSCVSETLSNLREAFVAKWIEN